MTDLSTGLTWAISIFNNTGILTNVIFVLALVAICVVIITRDPNDMMMLPFVMLMYFSVMGLGTTAITFGIYVLCFIPYVFLAYRSGVTGYAINATTGFAKWGINKYKTSEYANVRRLQKQKLPYQEFIEKKKLERQMDTMRVIKSRYDKQGNIIPDYTIMGKKIPISNTRTFIHMRKERTEPRVINNVVQNFGMQRKSSAGKQNKLNAKAKKNNNKTEDTVLASVNVRR